ncbi:50S ribosomal protein L15 [Patescibacteria group bacterium]|nr:50S ribosomal protein L15 [Patescibacteria group bacterium]
MQLNNLKRKNPNKTSVKIGRGGKRGKTSGRGHKGQNARAGTSKRPDVRDLIKRLPKKRGYKFKSFQERPVLVNLAMLENNFATGEDVTPKILVEKLIVKKKENKVPSVKILGNGELTIKLNVSDCSFSQSAKDKIEKNGGTIK